MCCGVGGQRGRACLAIYKILTSEQLRPNYKANGEIINAGKEIDNLLCVLVLLTEVTSQRVLICQMVVAYRWWV